MSSELASMEAVAVALHDLERVEIPAELSSDDLRRMLPHDQIAHMRKLVTYIHRLRAAEAALRGRAEHLRRSEHSGIGVAK